MINPLNTAIAEAEELIDALKQYSGDLQLAMEAEQTKRRMAKEAKQAYDNAEAEFVAEALFNIDGKNAESRKAQLDAVLVAARTKGTLAGAWARMNANTYEAEDAKIALEQASVSFSAVKHAADLKAAILRASVL